MRILRVVLLLVVLAALGIAGASKVKAEGGVYPPLAEACDRYPGETWEVPTDDVVDAYSGCLLDEGVDASGDISCPLGTEPNGSLCYPVSDDGEHCPDMWVEVVGGTVDMVCLDPTGYENGFVYEAPSDICSSGWWAARVGMTAYLECVDRPDDKGIYDVLDTAYVSTIDGLGAPCLKTPEGEEVTTLANGTEVSELADGNPDGWQLVSQLGSDSCYVLAELLSPYPPTTDSVGGSEDYNPDPSVDGDEEQPVLDEPDASVDESDSGVIPADNSGELTTDVTLPATGVGPIQHERSLISMILTAAVFLTALGCAFWYAQRRSRDSRLSLG